MCYLYLLYRSSSSSSSSSDSEESAKESAVEEENPIGVLSKYPHFQVPTLQSYLPNKLSVYEVVIYF